MRSRGPFQCSKSLIGTYEREPGEKAADSGIATDTDTDTPTVAEPRPLAQ